MTSLAELVKERRTALGMTQEELADLIGVDRSYIGHIEGQRMRLPGEDIMRGLARYLRLSMSELASAAYEAGGPPSLPEEPSIDDLLRDARVQFQKVRPIRIPFIQQSAAAGYIGGAPAEIEMDYWPEPQHRNHKLLAIRVSGTCLEPRLMDGHTAIVDRNIDAKEGDIVLALHEGEAILKEYRLLDGVLHLVALQGQPPIRVNSETRIVGVVVDAKYKP